MVTRVLIALNVLVFIGQWSTGLENPRSVFQNLDEWGPGIAQGEWWRIFTSAFMHGSIMHIGFNMLALFQVGSIVEGLAGARRMLLLYVLALIGAGLAVYYFNFSEHTLGASGAIFGLFGALVAYGLRLGARGRGLIASVTPIIVINLVIGFSNPGISNAAHIGGLITGFLAGLIFTPTLDRRAARVQE